MQFRSALLAFLVLLTPSPLSSSSLLAGAFDGGDHDQQQPIVDNTAGLKVPGDNPLRFCSSPVDNVMQIDYVDISPNPPKPGETLTVKASGSLSKKVKKGSKVFVEVKYGLIRLLTQELDLCNEIKNVDITCPLDKGRMTIAKEVKLPKEIPPGRYTVLADAYDQDDERLTCLRATVMFHPRRPGFWW